MGDSSSSTSLAHQTDTAGTPTEERGEIALASGVSAETVLTPNEQAVWSVDQQTLKWLTSSRHGEADDHNALFAVEDPSTDSKWFYTALSLEVVAFAVLIYFIDAASRNAGSEAPADLLVLCGALIFADILAAILIHVGVSERRVRNAYNAINKEIAEKQVRADPWYVVLANVFGYAGLVASALYKIYTFYFQYIATAPFSPAGAVLAFVLAYVVICVVHARNTGYHFANSRAMSRLRDCYSRALNSEPIVRPLKKRIVVSLPYTRKEDPRVIRAAKHVIHVEKDKLIFEFEGMLSNHHIHYLREQIPDAATKDQVTWVCIYRQLEMLNVQPPAKLKFNLVA